MVEQQQSAPGSPPEPRWPGLLVATAICVRFFSRLPAPRMPGESDIHGLPDFRLVLGAMPLAALVISAPAAIVIVLAGLAGLSGPLAATMAVAALALTTGALHEDGLADTADGLFGGSTPERRLEIMRDSRIGSYGAMALGLSLLLRVTALAGILAVAGVWATGAVLLVAAIWSRNESIRILAALPPARAEGRAASVGRPAPRSLAIGLAGSISLAAALTLAAELPLWGLFAGLALSAGAIEIVTRQARRLIGGQTGDIIGAAQQLCEICVYLGFSIALGLGRP